MSKDLITHIISNFKIKEGKISFQPITHGYINNTYLVYLNSKPKYVLQRINQNVFKNADQIQHNIDNVLKILKGPNYSKIEFLVTSQKKTLLSHEGHYWRLMTYIKESQTYNTTQDSVISFEAGKIIGLFHELLKNENLEAYHDIIPNFHDIRFRSEQFHKALKGTSDLLRNSACDQIEFTHKILPEFDPFYRSNLPLRLCHNDTKLNNILFNSNKKGLCLIDLDTIMKGHFHYDFGDAVRTIVNHAKEDENDLSKITFDTELFNHFIEGIKASKLKLTHEELDLLPLSVALMPFLHGIRALSDHLNGNIYYKVSYPEQNLDRCKALFQFTKLALNNLEEMENYVALLK